MSEIPLPDAEVVHMVRCPFCSTYHRFSVKLKSIGGNLPPKDVIRFMKATLDESFKDGQSIECPVTDKIFTASGDDWLHLTEEEFHSRFPGNRSN